MAKEKQDTNLLSKVLCGDLVANEAKYHLSCLVKYRNRYRSFMAQRDTSQSDSITKVKMVKARALVELATYMENVAEDGTFLFKLSKLHSHQS